MNGTPQLRSIGFAGMDELLGRLMARMRVFRPVAQTGRHGSASYSYTLQRKGMPYLFTGFRPEEPLKFHYFAGRMTVAEYPSPHSRAPWDDTPETAVIGAAACDVAALRSLDVIFLQKDWTDHFYRARRERTLLISADCTEPRDTCLCTKAGIGPFATQGYDLNISSVTTGYIVESGSPKGDELLEREADLFAVPEETLLDERARNRKLTTHQVDTINREYTLSVTRPELLRMIRESDEWREHVKTCVACGACLFACPTCHCFVLSDHEDAPGRFARVKAWDACSYGGYSRMAGGSSPRLGLTERFRHRYLHKFEYYPVNFGFEACTGCGRCIAGCMGRIDMRRVFTALDAASQGVTS